MQRPIRNLYRIGADNIDKFIGIEQVTAPKIKIVPKVEPIKRTRDKDNILNHIIEGDCVATMKTFKDDIVDISITSPPYNVSETTRGNLYATYKDNLSIDEYGKWLIEIGVELIRVTKYYTFFNVQILTNNKLAVIDFIHYFRANIKDIFIWNKTPIPQIAKNKLATGYELIIILGKDSRMIYDYNNFPPNNFVPNTFKWIQKGTDLVKSHGATFPIKMVKFFIEQFSKPGDIVLDCFMGTGTTALGAIEMKRNYCGIELDPLYVGLAKKRIEDRKDDFEYTLDLGD